MKTLTTAVLFVMLGLSSLAQAGTKTTSFQATFVINEACAVQSGNNRPVVNCQFSNTYHSLTATDKLDSAPRSVQLTPASTTTATPAQVWTVTF